MNDAKKVVTKSAIHTGLVNWLTSCNDSGQFTSFHDGLKAIIKGAPNKGDFTTQGYMDTILGILTYLTLKSNPTSIYVRLGEVADCLSYLITINTDEVRQSVSTLLDIQL